MKIKENNLPEIDINRIENINFYLCLAIIAIVTIIAFFPSLLNQFTNWDDNVYITNNWKIKNISFENLKYIFSSTHYGGYEPLTELSFAIDYYFFKLNPFIYHFDNFILHLINSILVFILVYKLCKKKNIALLSGLLWSIHPMRVESVAWISERKDVLFSVFFLLSLILYIKHIENKNIFIFVLSVFFYILSLLPKQQGIMLPFVLIAIDYFLNNKLTLKSLFNKIPYFIIFTVFFIILIFTTINSKQVYSTDINSMFKNFLYANFGIIFYLLKFILPVNLANLYPLPDVFWGINAKILLYIAPFFTAVLFGVIILWVPLKKWISGLLKNENPGIFNVFKEWLKSKEINKEGIVPAKFNKKIIFGSLFFLLNLIIVLQFIRTGPAIVADRYTYLPYIGLCYIAADGFFIFINKAKSNNVKISLLGFSLIVITIFVVLTFLHCSVWKNSFTLWNNTLKHYPDNPLAHNNMAEYYFYDEKNDDLAIKHLEKAIELDPNYDVPYTSLGSLYQKSGRLEDAVRYYEKAIKINPDSALSYYNLGVIYHNLNILDKAVDNYKKTISSEAAYIDVYFNLIKALISEKNYSEARIYLDKLIGLNYKPVDVFLLYGDMLTDAEKYKEAEDYYYKAFNLIDDKEFIMYKLAVMFTKSGEYKKAFDSLDNIKYNINEFVYVQYALIYKKMHDNINYKTYLDKALKINPEAIKLIAGE